MSFNLNDMDDAGVVEAKDVTIGRKIFDSNLYNATVKLAYGDLYLGDAKRRIINLEVEIEEDGEKFPFQTRIWLTDKETGKIYKEKKDTDKETGKDVLIKVPVYGYTQGNEIARLVTGRGILEDQKLVSKELQVWDATEKKNVSQMKQVFAEWTGKPLGIAMLREIQDEFRQGKATGRTAERNNVAKYVAPKTFFTANEIASKATEAKWSKKWIATNKGKVNDRSTVKKDGQPSELEAQTSSELDELFKNNN